MAIFTLGLSAKIDGGEYHVKDLHLLVRHLETANKTVRLGSEIIVLGEGLK